MIFLFCRSNVVGDEVCNVSPRLELDGGRLGAER